MFYDRDNKDELDSLSIDELKTLCDRIDEAIKKNEDKETYWKLRDSKDIVYNTIKVRKSKKTYCKKKYKEHPELEDILPLEDALEKIDRGQNVDYRELGVDSVNPDRMKIMHWLYKQYTEGNVSLNKTALQEGKMKGFDLNNKN